MSDDDALSLIHHWYAESPLDVTVCECEPHAGQRALEALQVTARSPLGAVAFHTGGILVDGGFLRVLGAGCALLPRAIDTWNVVDGVRRCAEGLLVADDVVGGFFAWFEQPRTVHYLAPDTAEWEDLKLGYGDWLQWVLGDALPEFYANLRWPGWRDEIALLKGDRAIHIYPPLLAEGLSIGERNRRAVPVAELWGQMQDTRAMLNDPHD